MMLALVLLRLVAGDIPVHCLIADFAGDWVLHLGKPVQPGQSAPDVPNFRDNLGIEQDYCYSGHPNKNSRNVNLNVRQKFNTDSITADKVYAQLTENITVRADGSEHMVAHVGNFAPVEGKQASWTTTYDEGWELRVGPKHRFFALAHYRCAEGSDNCGQDGVGEDADGATQGYQSECGQTLVGWYHSDEGKGCFYGEKASKSEAKKVHSYVLMELAKENTKLPLTTAYHHTEFEFMPSFAEIKEHHKNGGSASHNTYRRAGGMKRHKADTNTMKLRDQCHGDDITTAEAIKKLEAEHPVFDWREQLGGQWNTPVMDQGGCGSCYAIAMTYVLQARANIMRLRELKKRGVAETDFPEPEVLSPHSVLSCSYYNQGCDGGYPYLVAKHATDFGVPTESCQPYGRAQEGSVDQCHGECFQDESKVVFAENYNYVGGFYGVCGQHHMMQSLMEGGPLVVALEVPIPFNSANGGHVVGESYLAALRQMRVDMHRDPKTDMERASPGDHHRRAPLNPVKMLEARWSMNEGKDCETSVAPQAINEAVRASEVGDAYIERGDTRFALNSDTLEASADPFATSRKAIADAAKVPESCVNLAMVDGTMNGWEYTNHAITLVGWGAQKYTDDDGNEDEVKYWIIRNSWGDYYGDQGYAYVLRGQNYAGLESQAVDVKIDRNRGMMKHWLGEMGPEKSSFEELGQKRVEVDALGNLISAD
jgi:cathepsin C